MSDESKCTELGCMTPAAGRACAEGSNTYCWIAATMIGDDGTEVAYECCGGAGKKALFSLRRRRRCAASGVYRRRPQLAYLGAAVGRLSRERRSSQLPAARRGALQRRHAAAFRLGRGRPASRLRPLAGAGVGAGRRLPRRRPGPDVRGDAAGRLLGLRVFHDAGRALRVGHEPDRRTTGRSAPLGEFEARRTKGPLSHNKLYMGSLIAPIPLLAVGLIVNFSPAALAVLLGSRRPAGVSRLGRLQAYGLSALRRQGPLSERQGHGDRVETDGVSLRGGGSSPSAHHLRAGRVDLRQVGYRASNSDLSS